MNDAFRPLLVLLALLAAPDVFAQTAFRSDFDHDSTGFRLDGAHLATSCGDCHSHGIFEGTLRECQDCHNQGSTVTATPKPVRHILSTEQCAACHVTRSFIPIARMDHTEGIGACASCHNNQAAPGKPVDHPPAGDNCEACHLQSTFEVVTFGIGNARSRSSAPEPGRRTSSLTAVELDAFFSSPARARFLSDEVSDLRVPDERLHDRGEPTRPAEGRAGQDHAHP